MQRIFLLFFLLLIVSTKDAWAQKSCSHYLNPKEKTLAAEKVLQDITSFFGNQNDLKIYDSEVSLKSTYNYDLVNKKWVQDPNTYKQSHSEFTIFHLENVPGLQYFFKLLQMSVHPPARSNEFSISVDFKEIINIEKNPIHRNMAYNSHLEKNILSLYGVSRQPRPDPDDSNNLGRNMVIATKWVFERQPDESLIIFQSDSIFIRQDKKVISGERYEFEIRNTPNLKTRQTENILDIYLERIGPGSIRQRYH